MPYKMAWNRWVKWCLKNEVTVITPQAKDLAKFFADLHITEEPAPWLHNYINLMFPLFANLS